MAADGETANLNTSSVLLITTEKYISCDTCEYRSGTGGLGGFLRFTGTQQMVLCSGISTYVKYNITNPLKNSRGSPESIKKSSLNAERMIPSVLLQGDISTVLPHWDILCCMLFRQSS